MKEIVIVSGKGGTGKTSFVAAFARLAGRRIVVGDCDVDAANLALLLPGDDVLEEPFFAAKTARISSERCSSCGECIGVCRFNALTLGPDNIPRVDPYGCEGCRACSVVCPEDAFDYVPKQSGNLYVRESPVGPLVHASLGVAQDNSGKLVTRVRQRARKIAEAEGIDTILLDGPPGIGCPVHASLGGASLVVAVTEPTPSGVHDLERLLKLCAHFQLKTALVVNKSDLGEALTSELRSVVEQNDGVYLGGVPFHRGVPIALARGQSPLEVAEVYGLLADIWEKIDLFESFQQ